jgi:thiamine pyrophosphate-dependent acetolactate synthase large subunit-like protein
MAYAYVKYSGKVGTCGPGAIHLLDGLNDAKAANALLLLLQELHALI